MHIEVGTFQELKPGKTQNIQNIAIIIVDTLPILVPGKLNEII